MLPIFRFGLGGRLGSGEQYWSWVERSDAAAAFVHLALETACEGPFNISAETPETNRRWTQAIGSAVRRPTVLPAPAFALRWMLGAEMADSMLLCSTRADGSRLRNTGFQYAFSGLEETMQYCLGSARFPTP
jgi:NAD dependent epimerase/dehydratase family enzyme